MEVYQYLIPTVNHSPGREVDNCSCTIKSSGETYWSYFATVTSYSYGSPDIRYTSFWWVDIFGAPDSYLHNDVSYSYGILWKNALPNILVASLSGHGLR